MSAYNTNDLYNKYVQGQASEAFHKECIDNAAYQKILDAHPSYLYTPNYFIRIGLALLTIVSLLFSFVLLWLLFGVSHTNSFTGLFIFFAFTCYGLLELMVSRKKYYNAGIDNILMIAVIILVITAININDFPAQYEVTSCLVMLICLWFTYRFTDAFMALLAFIACLIFLFLFYTDLGVIAKATAPFLIMIITALIFLAMKKLQQKKQFILYASCLQLVMILSMLTFYAAGNFFVIREMSNEMFNLNLQPNEGIPSGWLFWLFTIAVPPAYIFYGLRKKDRNFIRVGLILLAASVLTVRYYYAVMPSEAAMIVFGALLVLVSYVLIKYLSTPKYGFSFTHIEEHNKTLLNAEAIIIAQAFGRKVNSGGDHIEFGGGSSGGGGASGSY
jgi:hypothetical protein